MKFLLIILLAISSGLSFAGTPSQKTIPVEFKKEAGTTEFLAIGKPSALKIRGTAPAPTGTLNLVGPQSSQIEGTLSFDLDQFDTGLTLRNKHMKEKYLETQKFPQAKLTLTSLELPETIRSKDGKVEKVPFEGALELHGVKKPVTGQATLERSGNQLATQAEFQLKIEDFGIATPGYAGITMANEVNVQVHARGTMATVPSPQK